MQNAFHAIQYHCLSCINRSIFILLIIIFTSAANCRKYFFPGIMGFSDPSLQLFCFPFWTISIRMRSLHFLKYSLNFWIINESASWQRFVALFGRYLSSVFVLSIAAIPLVVKANSDDCGPVDHFCVYWEALKALLSLIASFTKHFRPFIIWIQFYNSPPERCLKNFWFGMRYSRLETSI